MVKFTYFTTGALAVLAAVAPSLAADNNAEAGLAARNGGPLPGMIRANDAGQHKRDNAIIQPPTPGRQHLKREDAHECKDCDDKKKDKHECKDCDDKKKDKHECKDCDDKKKDKHECKDCDDKDKCKDCDDKDKHKCKDCDKDKHECKDCHKGNGGYDPPYYDGYGYNNYDQRGKRDMVRGKGWWSPQDA